MCVYFCGCTQHSAHELDDSLQESVLSYHASGIELRSYVSLRPSLRMYMHLCIYEHVHKHQHTYLLETFHWLLQYVKQWHTATVSRSPASGTNAWRWKLQEMRPRASSSNLLACP